MGLKILKSSDGWDQVPGLELLPVWSMIERRIEWHSKPHGAVTSPVQDRPVGRNTKADSSNSSPDGAIFYNIQIVLLYMVR